MRIFKILDAIIGLRSLGAAFILGVFTVSGLSVSTLANAHEQFDDRASDLKKALKNELKDESQAVKNGIWLRYRIAHSEPGDIIEIEPGHYTLKMPAYYHLDRFIHYEGGILDVRINHDLTLRGTDPDASKTVIDYEGSDYAAQLSKAMFVTRDSRRSQSFPDTIDLTVENLTFQNATSYSSNGAALRPQGGSLTVRNCRFINNENGILFTSAIEQQPRNEKSYAGKLIVEDSYFEGNGQNYKNLAHGIYMSQGALLKVSNSQFINTKRNGHHIKSLAAKAIITGTTFSNEENEITYNIDTPNGGDVTIEDSVFSYYPAADGEDNRNMFFYGVHQNQGRKKVGDLGYYHFNNNVINNYHSRAILFGSDEGAEKAITGCGNQINNFEDGKIEKTSLKLTKACQP